MKAFCIALLGGVPAVLGLKFPHLELSSVECTAGVSELCAEQCERNYCYAAKNDGQLNACLRNLDATCSVRIRGTVNMTMERDVDFCNVYAEPPQAAGWLLNIPNPGRWAVMKNPYVGIPRTLNSPRILKSCDAEYAQMVYATSPTSAVIERRICLNPTTPDSNTTLVFRDLSADNMVRNVYPVAVYEDVNAMFLIPRFQDCWAPVDELTFTVEVEHDIFGGHGVILDRIVTTGTIPLSHLIHPPSDFY